jgi:hypothetical protein
MPKTVQVWNYPLPIKHASMLCIVLAMLISLSTVAFLTPQTSSSGSKPQSTYMGVSFCGNTTAEAKLLIDKVKTYTNLFVLQSGPISTNETATNEICDYATSQGLNIIVYFGWFNPDYPWQSTWVQNATQHYGTKFLGVYYYDEPGGVQLDYDWTGHFQNMSKRLQELGLNNSDFYRYLEDSINGYLNGTIRDYDVEAQAYIQYMQYDPGLSFLKNNSICTFVSDYSLYWWDYKGGYDVVLCELGNNASITQEIDLAKGAAHMQDKDWGAIVTWKYDEAPYLDNGTEIYNQLSTAYQAGAKYLIVFDYPTIEGNPYGVLTNEHFAALQKIWRDINRSSSKTLTSGDSSQAEAVLVLPHNYGWGMRWVDDRVWLWGPDEYCPQIWNLSRTLISQYGIKLDIVYDESYYNVTGRYQQVYYWN